MKYFIVVGEASGDVHAAGLMASLKEMDSSASFCYVGGPRMRAEAGGQGCLFPSEELSYMGVWEVLKHYGVIRRAGRKVQEGIGAFLPDVVVCVDYPGFNFRYVLPFLDSLEVKRIPLVYYIPPKVWAWKSYRVKALKDRVDRVLCIFPFEIDYFRSRGVSHAHYVGNPSLEQVKAYEQEGRPRREDLGQGYIALLAGSRLSEIRSSLPVMLEVVRSALPGSPRAVVAAAPGVPRSFYESLLSSDAGEVQIVYGDTFGVLSSARAALVTSGTATLEAALLGVPQVVCYKVGVGHLANVIFSRFFSVPYISLVNINAGEEVVQECYGGRFRVSEIRRCLLPLLQDDSPERVRMLQQYALLRERLDTPGRGAGWHSARLILDLLEKEAGEP